jgi:hypothetical protein
VTKATVNPITSNDIANQIVIALRSHCAQPPGLGGRRIPELVTALSHLAHEDSTYAALARAAALVGDIYSIWELLSDEVVEGFEARALLTRVLRLAWLQLFFVESYWGQTAADHHLDYFAPIECARELFPHLDVPAATELAQAAE